VGGGREDGKKGSGQEGDLIRERGVRLGDEKNCRGALGDSERGKGSEKGKPFLRRGKRHELVQPNAIGSRRETSPKGLGENQRDQNEEGNKPKKGGLGPPFKPWKRPRVKYWTSTAENSGGGEKI